MTRLFIALDLPQAVRMEVAGLCCGLPGARWVPDDQIHLTLRFIGEVDGGVFQDIREGLAGIRGCPFVIRLVGLGCFPPRKQPRILWAGIAPVEPVALLRNRVESILVQLGLAPEGRKFAPHVTLARFQAVPIGRLARYLADNALFASAEFEVDAFHLYSSFLTRKGALHQLEASYFLSQPSVNQDGD
jgi:RNA 2',3'-cyclic 3'-phosphodiesterase